ncbi:4'-phosphopantetheinyl transferase family protein [Streptomyces xantholiticus]|uniref:4'-phosphopantetheinyl transferase superfamily protein n=1 Tax=Streptomyces xantholiticus TaxID=68285 RepID=A0ABV1UXA2_9ACTN
MTMYTSHHFESLPTARPQPVPRPEDLVPAAWARPAPPRPEAPRLWLARVEDLRDVVAPLAASVLDGGERAREAALRRAVDRDGYRVTHVGLRLLLGAYLGIDPPDVPLARAPCPECRGPHGRPVVREAALHFSVSRAPGYCLLAFAVTEVGADVEKVPSSAVVEETSAALHPREAAELAACPPADRPAAFARAWTRKEGYLKGLGTGLGRDLRSDHLGTSPHVPTRIPGWSVSDVSVPAGYAAAVVVRAAPGAPSNAMGAAVMRERGCRPAGR